MFTAILTGAQNGLQDLSLPVTYIQGSLKRTGRDYMQLVCGAALHLVPDITARPDGELVLYKAGAEIARVNFNEFSHAEGARSGSVTLSGYKQVTRTGSAKNILSVIEYDGDFNDPSANKRMAIGWEYIGEIYPADTATGDGKTMGVDTVLFSLSASGARVEIKEEP